MFILENISLIITLIPMIILLLCWLSLTIENVLKYTMHWNIAVPILFHMYVYYYWLYHIAPMFQDLPRAHPVNVFVEPSATAAVGALPAEHATRHERTQALWKLLQRDRGEGVVCGWLAVLCGFVLLYFLDVSFDVESNKWDYNPDWLSHAFIFFIRANPQVEAVYFHPDCFCCDKCQKPLTGKFHKQARGSRAQNPSQIAETMA